jgi:hypothetical protein
MSPLPSKKLQEIWNKKLKDSGFKDIESPSFQFHGHMFTPIIKNVLTPARDGKKQYSRLTPASKTAREQYYRLAGHFLYEYEGFTPTTKKIWELHAQGETVRDIADKLSPKGPKRSSVFYIIKKLSKIMISFYGVTYAKD